MESLTPQPARRTGGTDWTQLHLDVAFRRAGGRIIWQPRILAWISDREFAGEPLPAPYTGMSAPELYRALGCSNRIYEFNACLVSHEDPVVCESMLPGQLFQPDQEPLAGQGPGYFRLVIHSARVFGFHLFRIGQVFLHPVEMLVQIRFGFAERDSRRKCHTDRPKRSNGDGKPFGSS